MSTIANWNGHTFVVSPSLIRGYTDLQIKGSCETTTKNSEKQKYVEHKYGEIPEISMVVHLNAQTGVTDVYGEAMEYVQEATDGACAYFYLGGTKLIPAQMMLTEAEVLEIVNMPGQGNKWISCDVKLKFKQGSKDEGNSSGSAGSGNATAAQKATTKTHNLKDLLSGTDTLTSEEKDTVTANINKMKQQLEQAKAASTQTTTGGLQYQNDLVKQVTDQSKSAAKTQATTSRSCDITLNKITRVSSPEISINMVK